MFKFYSYFTGENDLTGTIPSEIGLLTDLNDLELCKLLIGSSTGGIQPIGNASCINYYFSNILHHSIV